MSRAPALLASIPVALLVSAGARSPTANADTCYRVTDLGASFFPADINNAGQIVGAFVDLKTQISRALLHHRGTVTDLGDLGASSASATAINEAGVIVGVASVPPSTPGATEFHGFVWRDGVLSDLGALATPGPGRSRAEAINAGGLIVGTSVANDGFHAVLWDGDELLDLGGLPGLASSTAVGISKRGVIAGNSNVAGGGVRAWTWKEGEFTELPSLGGGDSVINAVNRRGWIVGHSSTAPGGFPIHAFFYRAGVMTDLGTLGFPESFAFGINKRGDIVGFAADTDSSDPSTAFLYRQGQMQAIDDLLEPGSPWLIAEAADINDRGLIVGLGVLDGAYHGVLLRPRRNCPPP
jgi:probable HAF family extracellular repeat protein